VKRVLATAVLLAGTVMFEGPALAAGTPQYGSVQLQWNVATLMTAHIATNYGASFSNGATTTLLSNPASTCAASNAAAGYQINFGAVTPSSTAEVACTATNALATSVITNDTAGYKVNEYLNAAPAAGIVFCTYPNGAASFPVTADTATFSNVASARTGTGPTAWSGTACGTGGLQITAGTGTLGGGTGGSDVGGTGQFLTAPTAGTVNVVSTTAADAAAGYTGQDLQINLAANQASSSSPQDAVMTVQFIPN
jgi:hypothetical protein